MENKIFGTILLICAGLVFQEGYHYFRKGELPPITNLKSAIEADILNSLFSKKLKEGTSIHHVKLIFRSQDAHKLFKDSPPEFLTNKAGTLWLEIEVLDLPDEQTPGLITQTSIFDLKTQNKIGEFGSTYYLKDFGLQLPTIQFSNRKEILRPKQDDPEKDKKSVKAN